MPNFGVQFILTLFNLSIDKLNRLNKTYWQLKFEVKRSQPYEIVIFLREMIVC